MGKENSTNINSNLIFQFILDYLRKLRFFILIDKKLNNLRFLKTRLFLTSQFLIKCHRMQRQYIQSK